MDLIILGIDGADPEYLEKAMEKYDLENWERLMQESFYTELPSTVPAITIPAWQCMFSGMKPETLEVYHMGVTDLEDWEIKFADSTNFKGKFFWDRIDKKVGLQRVPGTAPIYPINGWAREGFPSPEDFNFYPEELEEELEGIELTKINSHGKTTAGAKIKAEKENLVKERKIADHIFEKDPDVFTAVFQFVDRSGHFAEKGSQILESYKELDETVGKYLDRAEEKNANLIVVSDHGFQHATSKFNLVKFLEKEGYAGFEAGAEQPLVYRLAEPLLNTPIKKYLKYIHDFLSSNTDIEMRSEGGVLGSVSKESEVVPFFAEGREAGLVVHTEKYPHGNVDPGKKGEVLEEISKKLEKVEKNGEEVVEEIWTNEELYGGSDSGPDLVFKVSEGMLVSPAHSSKLFDKTNSFTHGETGVFFAKGPDLERDSDIDLEIYDVAPLIYALLDEPIPDDLDGNLPDKLVPDKQKITRAMDAEDISF